MNKIRLLKVVELLRTPLPPKTRFDLGTFIETKNLGYLAPSMPRPVFKPASCGSSACACGLAAMHPWFIAKGFKVGKWVDSYDGRHIFGVTYAGNRDFDAAGAFFGLYRDHALFLFEPNSYPDNRRRTVANRIESYVKTNSVSYTNWLEKGGSDNYKPNKYA